MNEVALDRAAPPAPPQDGKVRAVDPAWELASWTKLSPEAAEILYDGLRETHRELISSKTAIARQSEFAAIADVARRMIYALCRAAFDADKLAEYCRAILGREASVGRAEAELAEIRSRIGVAGTAHALVDRARGLIPTTMFGVLDRLAQAIGYVEVAHGTRRDIVGTAFLIRRDVVITSAHVAFEQKNASGQITTTPPPRADIRICFPVTPVNRQEAWLADNPVLAHSQAYLSGINTLLLDVSNSSPALDHLDFALLRLDRAIDRVDPIGIAGSNNLANGRLAFLIGFPGQNAAMFDAAEIVRDEPDGGRVIHMINSMPGMSGGCVIADDGVAIGIHEGAIPRLDTDGRAVPPIGGVAQVENRAIRLDAISKRLNEFKPNPLLALDQPPSVVMLEEALIARLGRRSAQLLADATAQPELARLVAQVTKPQDDGQPWIAHPWFVDRVRERIQTWFGNAAASGDTRSRVAYINGPRGSGKTFMIDVLKRVVTDAGSRVLRVAWSEGETTIATLGRQLAMSLDVSGTRTAEGHARYESVPDLIVALERYGLPLGAPTPRVRPLFLAIDAGDGTGSVTEPESWIDLVVTLAQQSWGRVVICGLPDDLMQRVADALPRAIECQPFLIGHVRSVDIAEFLTNYGMPPGSTLTPQEAVASFDDPAQPHKACPDLTTAMAALCAIGWHRGLLPVETGGQP